MALLRASALVSRYVRENVTCPSVSDFDRFGDWLVAFGESRPGLFLYATSDDTAWLYASRREELARYYRMYQPALETIAQLLNKRHLYTLCAELGIDYPETVYPDSTAALASLPASVRFPVVIKPTSQVGFVGQSKGEICADASNLVFRYERFREHSGYPPQLVAYDPLIAWPMIQAWHREAMSGIYSLAGFIDEDGGRFLVRAARKVLQRPRRLGIGLCFEDAPISERLATQVYELCRKSGYYGVFEVEFIHVKNQDRYLLIDFNPRFYGQMGFEIARELPLPGLVYAAARPPARRAVAPAFLAAPDSPPLHAYHYANKWLLAVLLTTQRLSRRLSSDERQHWLAWRRNPDSTYVDAICARGDRLPYFVDILVNLAALARHPRAFVRQFFLDARGRELAFLPAMSPWRILDW